MSSPYELEHLMAHEFTHIAQFEALYGGFWRSARLIKGLSGMEPLWIMEGMAETIAHDILEKDWTSYDRMIIRDAYLYDRLYTFRELQNFAPLYKDIYLGYKQGHSGMDFLVEKEGRNIHQRLLKSMRNNFDPLKAFETAVTQFRDLRDFNSKWKEWLGEQVEEEIQGRDRAEETYTSLLKDDGDTRNPAHVSPGSFYYVSDRWGLNEIYLHTKGQDRKILSNLFVSGADNLITGDRIYDRIIDYCPQSETLVFAARRNQRPYLYIYSAGSGSLERIDTGLEEIRSPAVAPGGKMIAFTAREGFNRNIYIYDSATGKTRAVTNDRYPDFGPIFSPDGSKIISASERYYKKDLREIEIETGSYTWLTDTPHNDFHPSYAGDDKIIYISDKNGVNNIYSLNSSTTALRVTNIESGAFYPVSAGNGKILASLYYDGKHRVSEIPFIGEDTVLPEEEKVFTDPLGEIVISTASVSKRRARGRFSTDFFFPSFLYATDIGFVGGGVIRMSDYFAHNTVEAYGWAWPGSYETTLQYINSKYRPDLFVALSADRTEYRAIDRNKYRRTRLGAQTGYRYPLTRYTAFTHYFQASSREVQNLDEKETTSYRSDTGTGFILQRNTAILKPFQAIRGGRISVGAYLSRPMEKDGLDYNTYSLSAARYTPLRRNLIMAKRGDFVKSEREDARRYGLGGTSLRGYSSNSFTGRNAAVFSTELRAMLFPRMNWHIPFMWPDINLYSFSAKVFTDAGTAFNDSNPPDTAEKWGFSYGFGFKLNFYMLQLAPGFLSVELATPYKDSDTWRVYWSFAAGHIAW